MARRIVEGFSISALLCAFAPLRQNGIIPLHSPPVTCYLREDTMTRLSLPIKIGLGFGLFGGVDEFIGHAAHCGNNQSNIVFNRLNL